MSDLTTLVRKLRQNRVFARKQVIGECIRHLKFRPDFYDDGAVWVDDGHKYVAVLDEVTPFIVKADPYRAGRTAMLVNVADIVAMGGTPMFALNAVRGTKIAIRAMAKGLAQGAEDTGVPLVGGHVTLDINKDPSVSVTMFGRVSHKPLLSSAARPGDTIIVAIDLDGNPSKVNPQAFVSWNKPKHELWKRWSCIIALSQFGFVHAGKDISNTGIIGTLTMMCEASGYGATLDIDEVPYPMNQNILTQRWLLMYQTMGFIFAVEPANVETCISLLGRAGFRAKSCGRMRIDKTVRVKRGNEEVEFWNLERESIFGYDEKKGKGCKFKARTKEEDSA